MSPRKSGADTIVDAGAADWEFELSLHPAQQEIWEHQARFKVVAAGRRFGKTVLGTAKVLVKATSKPNAVGMWVSPSHDQSRMARNMVANAIPRKYREVNRTYNEVYLPNGSKILFRSGERWDNLRGEGLDVVVLDEAAFLDLHVWTDAIRPALADKEGQALLISTFNGENWFYDLERAALDPKRDLWHSWRFTSYANPYVKASEIDEARASLPHEVAEQEFMANPLAFSGAVFDATRIEAAYNKGTEFVAPPAAVKDVPLPDGTTQRIIGIPAAEAGLDWGWNVTALEVCIELPDGQIAWVDEVLYERRELNEKCEEIAEVCKRWNVQTVYTDAADPSSNHTLAVILERAGVQTFVQPVQFAVYKTPGIRVRSFMLQNDREIITPICHRLFLDSKAYRYDDSGEKPMKGNDHSVDAATAFYASRTHLLGHVLTDDDDRASTDLDLLMEAA